ncbi:TetR-like C-terminal domain-containing protein [Saccharomonospora sp. NPDC006951]
MPRMGLSTQQVVSAAADIADTDGFGALSLAKVAARVGVRVPSLYKHVGSLDELRCRLGVLGATELGEAIRDAAVGLAGRDALRACCRCYRDYARAHPGRYAATQYRFPATSPLGAEFAARSGELLDLVLAVLRGYALDGEDAIHAARLIRSGVHGFVVLEELGGFGLPTELDTSFDKAVDIIEAGLRSLSTKEN